MNEQVSRIATLIVLVLTGLCGSVATSLTAGEQKPSSQYCGAKCLYVALVSLDIDPGAYDRFLEQCGEADTGGYSLGRLKEIAEAYGAKTLVVKTSLDHLSRRQERFACIAHVDGSHFIMIAGDHDGAAWVIDPPQEGLVSSSMLKTRWPGNALLISNVPLSADQVIASSYRTWLLVMTVGLCVLAVSRWLYCRRAL